MADRFVSLQVSLFGYSEVYALDARRRKRAGDRICPEESTAIRTFER